jgi:hypothetical protein
MFEVDHPATHAPIEMEALVARCGLTVVEHPTADHLFHRHCSSRTDGLRPYTLERLISARQLINGEMTEGTSRETSHGCALHNAC